MSTSSLLALSSAALPSVGCNPTASFSEPASFEYLYSPIGATGRIPASVVVDRLVQLEVIDWAPRYDTFVDLSRNATVADAIAALELALDATHCDRRIVPNDFEVYRPQFLVELRLVKASAAVTLDQLEAAATLAYVAARAPIGVTVPIRQSEERAFFEDDLPVEGQGQVVARRRRVVNAGLVGDVAVTPLPGYCARVVGEVELAAFSGRDTDRSTSSASLDLDVPRGKWTPVLVIAMSEIGAAWSFGTRAQLLGGGGYLRVEVRVSS